MKKQTEKVNLCQRVYDHVRSQVISNQLRPGDRITESMLAEELQISRTPIREGLRLLAKDGVVTLYPNRYVEITAFSQKDIYDLGAVRVSLEVLGAKLAVFHGTNADFSRLEKLAKECSAAMAQGDFQARSQADSDFHLALMEISRNKFLYDLQKNLYTRVQMFQIVRFSRAPQTHSGGASHDDIVAALFARDEARVVEAVKSHLINFYDIDPALPRDFFEHL